MMVMTDMTVVTAQTQDFSRDRVSLGRTDERTSRQRVCEQRAVNSRDSILMRARTLDGGNTMNDRQSHLLTHPH